MKKLFLTLITFMIATVVLFSCKSDKVKLSENLSEDLLDSISLATSNKPGDTLPVSLPAARGLQWKAWEKWFKACPKNETFKKDIVYLGAASSKTLGYVLSNDRSTDRIDFYKICPDTSVFRQFFNKGKPVQQCDFSEISGFSFDMVAEGNVLKAANADLAAMVAKAKKVTIKAGTWRIESIDIVPFLDYINGSTNPKVIMYRKALLDQKNVVLTKVLKISGFEAEIESSDSLNVNLKALLANGLNVNVIPTDTTKKIGFDLNFKTSSSRTVTVSSSGEFSLFGQASKGKKL